MTVRRRLQGALLVAGVALAGLLSPAAQAQPMAGGTPGGGMPNMRAISGRPLPDRGMPAGMVTVRVARKTPASPVAGAEITALIDRKSVV